MATFTANSFHRNAHASQWRSTETVYGKYTFSAANFGGTVNDDLRFFKVPARARIVDCMFTATDLDTGSPAIVIDAEITDGTTTKTLVSGSTVGQAGGVARMNSTDAAGYDTGTNGLFVFQLTATTAAATAATSGTITASLTYTTDAGAA